MEQQIAEKTEDSTSADGAGGMVLPGVRTSKSISSLFAAVSKAQKAMGPVIKDLTAKIQGEKANYAYRYADLASVFDAIRDALGAQELCIMQPARTDGKRVTVTTILGHSSGEWMASSLTLEAASGMAQAIGSAITYCRRYSLSSLIGVAAEEDDDGAAATAGRGPNDSKGPDNRQQLQQRHPQQGQKQITPPPPRNDSGGGPPQQQGQPQSPEAGHLDPDHVKQSKENERREHERLAPLRALKATIWNAYGCKNAEDSDLLLAYATGDRSKTGAWLNNNPEMAAEVAERLSKWATENEVKPSDALGIIRNMESAKEAFPQ